jgi:hypothetical protein
VETGKIALTADGRLTNARANAMLKTAEIDREKCVENGRKGGLKSAESRRTATENNDLGKRRLEHTRVPEARSTTDSPSGNLPAGAADKPPKDHDAEAKAAKPDADIQQAFDAWNALAGELELPAAKSLDKKRRASIAARLRENGGLDAWNAALAALKGAPFLCGHGKEGWRANIDFVCQASSFRKLIEGAYAPKSAPPQMSFLTPIAGGKSQESHDPNDLWGIVAWVKTLDAKPNEAAGARGKWLYRGMVIDYAARLVAEAAGFSSNMRPNWSILKAWIDDGLNPTTDIIPVVKHLAEFFASKGNPAKDLNAFDKTVRGRKAA